MKYIVFLISSLTLIPINIYCQDSPKLEIGGYISNMQSVLFEDVSGDWISDNLVHNRLNLFWYPGSNLTGTFQLRTRFMYGQSFQFYEDYAGSVNNENNFLDLSWNIFEEKSFLLNTAIDRIYLQYTLDKFVITAGRQRINWGQSFVWNPNDIFNVQNFFEFDYVEKPGSDAIRLQYYPGYSSSIEIAAKLNNEEKLTAAAYYKFNKWGYDIQFLAGILDEEDYLIGLGWSGDIKGAGFRGESSYLQPKDNFKDTSGIMYTSVSLDYTFNNSLYIQTEILYSILPENFSIDNFFEFYSGPLTVKKMSFSKWNLFAQLSYPISPLINVNLSGMYFPDLKGYYAGPGLSYSLKENAELSLIFQVFSGEFPDTSTGITDRSELVFSFLRYKFSF